MSTGGRGSSRCMFGVMSGGGVSSRVGVSSWDMGRVRFRTWGMGRVRFKTWGMGRVRFSSWGRSG